MSRHPPLRQPRSGRLRMQHDPDFLCCVQEIRGLAHFMRLSLRKAAHAVMSSAAWQEIRVSSTRLT
jgi:hypothetical protein